MNHDWPAEGEHLWGPWANDQPRRGTRPPSTGRACTPRATPLTEGATPVPNKTEPHFEVVRTDKTEDFIGRKPIKAQTFHGRRVVGGETTWTTETMARAVGVERSIIAWIRDTLEAASFDPVKVTLEWPSAEAKKTKTEKAIYVNGVLLPRRVLYVDERGQSGSR